ncbi:MAG: hypothetical protein RL417_873 [Pseudomonadota bacterium]
MLRGAFYLLLAGVLFLCGCTPRSTKVQVGDPPSRAELESLAAPIALYPDPLLQRVLTAATFPDQILDAALFIERGGEPSEIARKPWERSVKYVANYPTILTSLADDIDRTVRLGAAFTESPDELRDCIQTLRRRAVEHGNLKSSAYQTVLASGPTDGGATILIEPTDPAVLYVPRNTTTLIYERPIADPAALFLPLATFGLGVALAATLDQDDFYYYGGPFYGPGFWYGGPIYRRWYTYRHDRWRHDYDYGRGHYRDWGKHRHELHQKHSDWRHHRAAGGGYHRSQGPPPDSRASFRPAPHRSDRSTGAPSHRGGDRGARGSSPHRGGHAHTGSSSGRGFGGHRGGGRH